MGDTIRGGARGLPAARIAVLPEERGEADAAPRATIRTTFRAARRPRVHYNGDLPRLPRRRVERHVPRPASHTAGADCVGCHMPKRRTDDAVHVVMTDHLIRRRPAGRRSAGGEGGGARIGRHRRIAAKWFRTIRRNSRRRRGGRALHGAGADSRAEQSEGGIAAAGEPASNKYRPQRADYYVDLAEGLAAAGQLAKACRTLKRPRGVRPARRSCCESSAARRWKRGNWRRRKRRLRRVTALAPDDAGRLGTAGPGSVAAKQERARRGRRSGRESAPIPNCPSCTTPSAALLLAGGDGAAAEKEFREAMRIQPGFAQAQANLASLLASRGEFGRGALSLRAEHPAEAGLCRGAAELCAHAGVVESGTAEAEKQVQAAVEADARLAGAHQLWGALLATRGDMDGRQRIADGRALAAGFLAGAVRAGSGVRTVARLSGG